MGKKIKRVIELEKVDINGKRYYKAVGANTLFFDERGFKQITKPIADVFPTESFLNCRFRVTSTKTKDFTVGTIYEVVNGFFKDNSDCLFPRFSAIKTFEELKEYLGGDNLGCAHYSISLPTQIEKVEEKEEAADEGFLNCKFRVLQTSPCGGLRADNVYEVEDGRFMDSYGMIAPMFCPLKDKRDLERFLTGIDFEFVGEE